MYDRVAGDDIDTGDELESLEHSKKEKNSINIYHDPSQAQKSLRGSIDDNTKDVLITHNYNKVKNNNLMIFPYVFADVLPKFSFHILLGIFHKSVLSLFAQVGKI